MDFTRQHYYEKGKTRVYCIFYRELDFKIGRDRSETHFNDINIDKIGKWRDIKT